MLFRSILISNAGEEYEFVLRELVLGEISEGSFFISGKNVSGFGEGYGLSEDLPVVSFVLNILSESDDSEDEVEIGRASCRERV